MERVLNRENIALWSPRTKRGEVNAYKLTVTDAILLLNKHSVFIVILYRNIDNSIDRDLGFSITFRGGVLQQNMYAYEIFRIQKQNTYRSQRKNYNK